MLIWIALLSFGLVVGALFSNFTEGRGLNLGMSLVVGIVGSVGGGVIGSMIIDKEIGPYLPLVLLSACAGSLILLIAVYLIKK